MIQNIFTAACLMLLFSCNNKNNAQSKIDSTKGLKDYYRSYFPIGVSVSPQSLQTDEAKLIIQQFNSITPENAMKMGRLQPKENEYYWKDADSIVAFARKNNLKLRGHTLVWHQETPDWLFKDANGKQVTKEVLLRRMKDHITNVVSRYKGIIYAWDVVNEAISDDKNVFYRNSKFYEICGEEYIAKAFEYAHQADPSAILFYNDYNEYNPVKRAKIITLIMRLRNAGVPVTAVGLQAHWSISEPTRDQLEKTLKAFSGLKMPLQITELDVSVYLREPDPKNPITDTVTVYTPEREAKQTRQYQMCFELFRKYRKNITGITFWNISDRHSWLDNFPVKNRKDYPLLFDKDLNPKKAFWKIAIF